MNPQIVLYVILTVTAPTHDHCGMEVSASDYSPARITADDLRLDGFGRLVNRKPIKFTAHKLNWGIIEGFCILDASGEVVLLGDLTADVRADAGKKPLELDITLPARAVERLTERLSPRWTR